MKIMPVRNKQLWMSNVLIIVCLAATAFFPTDGGFQSMVASLAFLVLLPILFIRFFLRRPLADFGVSWGDAIQGMLWLVAFLVVIIVLFVWAHQYTDSLLRDQIPLSVRSGFSSFLIYISIAGLLLAAQEFFFRGFVLNVWKTTIGSGAILAQMLFSLVLPLVASRGLPGVGTLSIAILSLCSGWIAYRSRSIWYSFFFFFISAILGISMVLVFVR